MLGLPDTCTTHVHIYMYNVCCNSDQLMIYSQEQQYKDKVIKNLQELEWVMSDLSSYMYYEY